MTRAAEVSRMMRRVLVDAARARQAAKRGHGAESISLDAAEIAAPTLGVSVRTVINDWNAARAWLHHELTKRGHA